MGILPSVNIHGIVSILSAAPRVDPQAPKEIGPREPERPMQWAGVRREPLLWPEAVARPVRSPQPPAIPSEPRQPATAHVPGSIHDGSSQCPPWRDILGSFHRSLRHDLS